MYKLSRAGIIVRTRNNPDGEIVPPDKVHGGLTYIYVIITIPQKQTALPFFVDKPSRLLLYVLEFNQPSTTYGTFESE